MKNQYAGKCHSCDQRVEPNEGDRVKHEGSWVTVCPMCTDLVKPDEHAFDKGWSRRFMAEKGAKG